MKNKIFKIIILPTEKASVGTIVLYHKQFPYDFDLKPKLNKLSIGINNTAGGVRHDEYYKSQHLYIISDDEIKKGDWFVAMGKWVYQYDNEKLTDVGTDYKKIIASTDRNITPNAWIPKSFIEIYIKAYNEGKKINEVELKMAKFQIVSEYSKGSDKGISYNPDTKPDGSIITWLSYY